MNKSRMMMAALTAALYPIDPGPTARAPYPWEIAEEEAKARATPPPPEVDALTKKQRKLYNKVLIETQSRDKALKAALEI